jgi:phosphatidylethanolamine/phosphatidyl-N-methylethanolamine N-methyltransferase
VPINKQGTMRRRLSQHSLFFRQFLTNYRTTGAILPSGRFLCAALSRFVGDGHPGNRRILEVGPGTGSVTRRIVQAMRPDDRLDLVELNESFVQCLRDRFQTEEALRPLAGRTRVLHCPVQQLPREPTYDLIISGLPLNNFSVAEVEEILGALRGLLKPGGTLSFFEYMAIRRLRAIVSGPAQRARLRGVGEALGALLREHEIHRDWIWPNLPPAWVHHVRL